MCYLHLTRFVRILLDRKDRMSMAVGLEVRVPFCDHRLVEYVYNTPWSLKTYDGREKSLLRGATRDVLPQSVVDRVKSPYPSTSDPQYGAAIQAHAKDLFGIWRRLAVQPDRPRGARAHHRAGSRTSSRLSKGPRIERVLDLAVWIDMYRPTIVF